MSQCTTQSPGSFEDDILTVLVQWLRQLTGVKTIRAYENAQRPNEQYITVFITGYEDYDSWPVKNFIPSDDDTEEGCEVVHQVRRVLVDVNVYKDRGMAINGQTKPSDDDSIQHRSAVDVANAIVLRSELSDQLEKLEINCMTLEDFGPVQNLRELVKNDFESRAYVQMRMLAEMNESGRLACIDKAELGTCFDDEPVLIDSNYQPAMGC